MEQTYSERETEFSETWSGYDGDDITKLLISAGGRLAALCLDDPAVNEAMMTLHRGLGLYSSSSIDGEDPRDWRAIWRQSHGADSMPLADKTTSLHAYAFYGLSPKGQRGPCSIDDIKEKIELVKTAVSAASDVPETPELDRTLLAAEGRLALDQRNSISLEHLAALANIGMKSIRNASAPSSGSGLEVKNGAATAESATRWLIARGGFKSSIWGQSDEEEDQEVAVVERQPEVEGEIFWIPFASDGSEFDLHKCLRGGGYTIGPKGTENKVDDYREALRRLARMRPAPYWRRPNSAGNWGIVTAEAFRPRTAAELGFNATGGDK